MTQRRPIQKILVANRGGIAVRILRTCREMGISTVAVFSEADRGSLHVRLADEAVPIGPAPAPDGYLVPERILEAAARTGADAIHPGAGFLAERADFNRACRKAGLVFVGPPPGCQEAAGAEANDRGHGSPGSSRHVEVQVVADEHGEVVHLGERESTLRRGHETLVEESPGPALDAAQRADLAARAVEAARAAGYVGAGTVQFRVDASRDVQFLGMRTCLAVGHPVTEMVTGIDLVRLQIEVAQGGRVPAQSDVAPRGHAVGARIRAEDPGRGFLPSPGKITYLRVPGGPGLRDDSGAYGGWVMPPDHDALISTLTAWAPTRQEAIERLRRALADYHVHGIATNVHHLRAALGHAAFRAGDPDTWNRAKIEAALPGTPDPARETVAIVAAAVAAHRRAHERAEEFATRAPVPNPAWSRLGRMRALRRGEP